MNHQFSRRELLKVMSAAGFGMAFASRTVADQAGEGGPTGKIPEGKLVRVVSDKRSPAMLVGGKVIQPERTLPIMHETDVLVVGGGPAGFAAAVASARAGVKTTLVERYGYFGGLWSGGLVLIVLATHAREDGKLVKCMYGIGDELLERHTKIRGAVINQGAGKCNPTTDPEATKILMDEMLTEAGVKVFLHSWAADAIMEGEVVRGAVLEGKSGRQAVVAKVVIDTTGDGDVFAAAGAEYEQRLHAIGLVHRLGNVDRADMAKLKEAGFKSLGSAEPLDSVRWVNLRGPSTDALDISELTRLEMEHRKNIWNRVQQLRSKPGGENVFLLQTAPQLGVRITRILGAVKQLTFEEAKVSTKFQDVIGVGGEESGLKARWPIPYGALVPKKLDGLLTAGRSISVDQKMLDCMRVIAPCLVTGHAAGAAAALSVQSNCKPRDVDIAKLQKLLVSQGAFLG